MAKVASCVVGCRILLLEHVRVKKPLIEAPMDWPDSFVLRLVGPHFNRCRVKNVGRAGLESEQVEELAPGGLFKLIAACKVHWPLRRTPSQHRVAGHRSGPLLTEER